MDTKNNQEKHIQEVSESFHEVLILMIWGRIRADDESDEGAVVKTTEFM